MKQRDYRTYVIVQITGQNTGQIVKASDTEVKHKIGDSLISQLFVGLPIGKQYTIFYNLTRDKVLDITCEHIEHTEAEHRAIAEMLGISPKRA